MTIQLYHCTQARSMRPLWALEEMGLPYELHVMQFPPRVFHKDYKEINPLGTIPCMIDGDVVMTESAGICQYLADVYGPTPLGVTPEEPEYGTYLNWLHRSDATLTFPQTLVLRYSQLEPEERRVPQVVEDYKAWFLGRLKSVERGLEGHDYLCGERFTMADVAVGYALLLASNLGMAEEFTPNIKAYFARLQERPAYQRALKL